jgi:hypothetical protein
MNKIFQKENNCKHEFLMNLQLQNTIIIFQFNVDIKEICKVTLALGLVFTSYLLFQPSTLLSTKWRNYSESRLEINTILSNAWDSK